MAKATKSGLAASAESGSGLIEALELLVSRIATYSAPRTMDHPYEIGKNYLIRTVTMIDTGRLVRVTEHELVLEDAAWVADTGRFADSLVSCNFNEVEPFPTGQVIVGRGSVIDAVQIAKLPREQK